jgi:hypothetical protein
VKRLPNPEFDSPLSVGYFAGRAAISAGLSTWEDNVGKTTMRTVFEDTTERENREDAAANNRGKRLTIFLWVFAVLFLFSSWRAYYWAANRKPPEPPPPPVSLSDPKQISDVINKFNSLVKEEKWDEAQQMLSTEALQRLTNEQKTLRQSLLAERQSDKVVEAVITGAGASTETTVRSDSVYYFADREYKIIPLVVVLENGRLVINSW